MMNELYIFFAYYAIVIFPYFPFNLSFFVHFNAYLPII